MTVTTAFDLIEEDGITYDAQPAEQDEHDYGTPDVQVGPIKLYKRMNLPPVKWLVDGLLKERGIGLIYGGTGVMKSVTSIDLACRMVNGKSFHGRPLPRSEVLYVIGEAEDEVQERIDAWNIMHGCEERPFVHPHAINIADEARMNALADAVNYFDGAVKLVIFDTLSDVTTGIKLNDPDDVNPKVKGPLLTFVRKTNASVLLVHHTGHDDSHERGARVLRDMTDTTIKVTKKGMDVKFTVEKLRRGQAGEEFYFKAKDVSQETGIDRAVIVVPNGGKSAVQSVKEQAADLSNAELLKTIVEAHPHGIAPRRVAEQAGWMNKNGKPNTSYYRARDTALAENAIQQQDGLLYPSTNEQSHSHTSPRETETV